MHPHIILIQFSVVRHLTRVIIMLPPIHIVGILHAFCFGAILTAKVGNLQRVQSIDIDNRKEIFVVERSQNVRITKRLFDIRQGTVQKRLIDDSVETVGKNIYHTPVHIIQLDGLSFHHRIAYGKHGVVVPAQGHISLRNGQRLAKQVPRLRLSLYPRAMQDGIVFLCHLEHFFRNVFTILVGSFAQPLFILLQRERKSIHQRLRLSFVVGFLIGTLC